MSREVEVEAEALLEALAHTLEEMELQKLGDTLAYVEGNACTIRQLKAETLGNTLGDRLAE